MKNIWSFKPLASVPHELKEEFDQFQLKNSISRIRVLGALFVCARLLIVALFSETNEILNIGNKFGLLNYLIK